MTKINPNKIKESFIDENGKYHREDGPAVTKHGGEQRWGFRRMTPLIIRSTI